ncbi:hypothetical protein C8J57DRAFT_1611168 [Mycena rebaudengoi]|nr:hypothetical protein C8J57DRAFT_1611168 [Mycena rebaudengoi]
MARPLDRNLDVVSNVPPPPPTRLAPKPSLKRKLASEEEEHPHKLPARGTGFRPRPLQANNTASTVSTSTATTSRPGPTLPRPPHRPRRSPPSAMTRSGQSPLRYVQRVQLKVDSPIVGISSIQMLEESIVKDVDLEEVKYFEEPYAPKAVRGNSY